ncbi:MAG: hypothetical protein LEGION0398_MBIBDBAK_01463 [Legionellaceae bacterium]
MHYRLMALFCLGLTSCSDYRESFSTEPGVGSGWQSMSKTYDYNNANDQKQEKDKESNVDLVAVQESSDVFKKRIDRQPEETLRIWFAPFQDEENNLYDASYVQTIVKKGEWLSLKNKRI